MHILFDLCSKFDFCRNSGLIPGEIQRRKSNVWREHVLLLNTRWRYAFRQCVNTDPFLFDLLCHIMVNWSQAAVDGHTQICSSRTWNTIYRDRDRLSWMFCFRGHTPRCGLWSMKKIWSLLLLSLNSSVNQAFLFPPPPLFPWVT